MTGFSLDISLLYLILFGLFLVSLKIFTSINYLNLIIYQSAFSIILSLIYLLLNAPDVSMTEISVGCCVSLSVMILVAIKLNYENKNNSYRNFIYLIIILILIFVFIYGASNIFDTNSIFDIHKMQSEYYLKNTQKEIGINSNISSILASYRGFDTLLETFVISLGAFCTSLIFGKKYLNEKTKKINSNNYNILNIIDSKMSKKKLNLDIGIIYELTIKYFVPYIVVFACFIQLNGDDASGGGFQAGSIFASILIAIDLIKKDYYSKNFINNLFIFTCFGLLVYIFTGLVAMLLDYNFLDYNYLNSNYQVANQLGISFVELGVGISVSSGLFSLYINFKSLS